MTPRLLIALLLVVSGLALLAACFLGSTPMEPARVIAAFFGQGTPGDNIVIWEIRLPRALAAFVVGAALGVSGAALQGLLRNPLAEPGVLGVTATSSLFATFALYYGFADIGLPVADLRHRWSARRDGPACGRSNSHQVSCNADFAGRWLIKFFGSGDVADAQHGAEPVYAVRYAELAARFGRKPQL